VAVEVLATGTATAKSGSATPSIECGPGAGIASTAQLVGTDSEGEVTLTAGRDREVPPFPAVVFRVRLATVRASAPTLVRVEPANDAAKQVVLDVVTTQTEWAARSRVRLSEGTVYKWRFTVSWRPRVRYLVRDARQDVCGILEDGELLFNASVSNAAERCARVLLREKGRELDSATVNR